MTNEPCRNLIAIQSIQNRIYEIRGERVTLDVDIIIMWKTNVLNQAVKSVTLNASLTIYVPLYGCRVAGMRSQSVTISDDDNNGTHVVTICDRIPK